MTINDPNLPQTLTFNAMLMLSYFGNAANLSSEEQEYYKTLISFEDASAASVFLLTVVMRQFAVETGRTPEEMTEHIRSLLLAISQMEG